jgi:hypothetical protein
MSLNDRASVFLERRSYRRRRLMDALRLAPVLGVMLFMLPVFWPVGPPAGNAVSTATAVTYIFITWALLIVLSLSLWLALRTYLRSDSATEEEGE